MFDGGTSDEVEKGDETFNLEELSPLARKYEDSKFRSGLLQEDVSDRLAEFEFSNSVPQIRRLGCGHV